MIDIDLGPVPCPRCKSADTVPCEVVGAEQYADMILMLCMKCGVIYEVEVEVGPPVWFPPEDREGWRFRVKDS